MMCLPERALENRAIIWSKTFLKKVGPARRTTYEGPFLNLTICETQADLTKTYKSNLQKCKIVKKLP